MEFERTFKVQARPEAIWKLIANTDSLNREIGLPSVIYSVERATQGDTQVIARASMLGQELEWVEHPFEWTVPQQYVVQREFRKGPFKSIRAGVRLQPVQGAGDETSVQVFARVDARGLIGRMGATIAINRNVEQVRNATLQFAKYLNQELNTPYPKRAESSADQAALTSGLERLREEGAAEALVVRLAEHIRQAPEEQLRLMRAFEWADRWEAPRLDVLRLFLLATRAEVVEMTWNVLCPCCRVSKQQHQNLQELRSQSYCDYCDLHFEPDMDRLVEVCFSVHPAIRATKGDTFCMGGPQNSPHVLAQQRVEAGGVRSLELPVVPGRYVLRVMPGSGGSELLIEKGPGTAELRAEVQGEACRSDRASVKAETLKIQLTNKDGIERLVRLEDRQWNHQAASAAQVTALQDFRDLFSDQFLANGEELALRGLSFLFTDLKGSTALYEQIGDARAYVLVRDHFEILTAHIREMRGAVVKTMGDAVMAVFLSPQDALRAALKIREKFLGADSRKEVQEKVHVKLGLHAGPCIAVTSDEQIDYFGRTVNLAQRVQAQSEGGDLVMSASFLERPGIQETLDSLSATYESFESNLKGFEGASKLYRVRWE